MEAIKKIIGMVVLIGCISITNVYGQYRFEGKVYDHVSGLELADVNLTEEISKLRTVSDSLGNFMIVTNLDRVRLQFSRMGYDPVTQEYAVSESPIRVYLHPSSMDIEEVEINTGYQWIPKERATGSFVHVGKEQLAMIPGRSIIDKLDGIMPGLQFDKRGMGALSSQKSVITVRGMNSFATFGSNPLIVVDNFPYEGDIESINPSDVESVTLLRDAAATSIWGARAGNGVIVVNLKKPDQSGGTIVSLSSNVSITGKPDLFYDPIMNSDDFVDMELFLYGHNYYRSALTGSNAHRTVFSPVVQAMYDMERGHITQAELDRIITDARNHDYRDELLEHYYRSKVNRQHHIVISKRTDKYGVKFSAGFDRVDGLNNMAIGDQYDTRYSFNLLNEYQFSEKLSASLNVGYSLSDAHSVGGQQYPLTPQGGKIALYPYARLIDENGQALAIPYGFNMNYVDTVGGGKLLNWKFRPMEDQEHVFNDSKISRTHPTLMLRYNPVATLHLEAIYSGEHQFTKGDHRYGTESYEVRDNVNRYTEVINGQVVHHFPMGEIFTSDYSDLQSYKFRFNARMDEELFGRDRLTWILGGEVSHAATNSISQRLYGYNPYTATSMPVDHIYRYPLYLGGTGTIPSGQNVRWGVRRLVSFFGNASYAFADRYILSGSVRRDASNVFGAKANERWNPLWSVGLAWNIHKEEFIKDMGWVSNLRFRITHGHSGNLGGGTTSDRVVISNQGHRSAYSSLPYAIISSPPNTSLKWENIQMNNYALDFAFFNDMISGGIELFTKSVTDLISADLIDPTTGFNSMSRNVAGIRGEGYDVNLNIDPFRGQFRWRMGVSLSHIREWTTEFYGNQANTATLVSSDNSIRPIVGKTLVPVFSYRFAGLDPDNGNPLGFLNDEVSNNYTAISRDSIQNLIFHGSARPLYHGYFNHTLTYRGLTLFFNFTFRAGHYYKQPTIHYNNAFNTWRTHSDFSKRWQTPGDERFTTVPSMSYPGNNNRDNFYMYSEANVERGDVIRLQQLRLDYQWKLNTSKINAVRLGINVNNLGVLWKAAKGDRDPDYFSIPPARMISTNINLLF